MIPKIRKECIRRLTEIVSAHDSKTGYPDRLTRSERKFFRKHPDMVVGIFKGVKSHVRANEMVRKMKAFGLDEEDVGLVYRKLARRDMEGRMKMKKSLLLSLIVFFVAIPCFGIESIDEFAGFGSSEEIILKEHAQFNGLTVKIYSTNESIDTSLILNADNLVDKNSVDSIKEEIDVMRRTFYPDEEIIVDIENKVYIQATRLTNAIYLWNFRMGPGGHYWSKRYSEAVACFMSLEYGRLKRYLWIENEWRSRGITADGWAGTTYGTFKRRGCRLDGVEDSKADIVLLYYR